MIWVSVPNALGDHNVDIAYVASKNVVAEPPSATLDGALRLVDGSLYFLWPLGFP